MPDALIRHSLRWDSKKWGTFDITTFEMKLDEAPTTANVDLIDAVARQTLKHGGLVYALDPDEMPDGAAVAALFRY